MMMARKKQPVWPMLPSIVMILLVLPFLLSFGLLVALAAQALRFLNKTVVYLLIWVRSLRKGNYVLVVYPDSTTWNDYVSAEVLPMVGERAVVLNWSERNKWPRWSLATHVFRTFDGHQELNPIVVVFRPLRRAEVLRFWQAFKDWTNGHTEPVERRKQRLLSAL